MMEPFAPAKCILVGEHAVVYGKKGISIPLEKLTTVSIHGNGGKGLVIKTEGKLSAKQISYLKTLIKLILKDMKKEVPNVEVCIKTQIEAGVGCGMSASISAALIRAFFRYFGLFLDRGKLFELTGKLEKMNHGNPSGIDHHTILRHKPLVFRKNKKSIEYKCVPRIMKSDLWKNCYLINTGKPKESTKEMVEFVAKNYKKSPKKHEKIFDEMELLVPKIQKALNTNDEKSFKNIVNTAGKLLEKLGVVSKKAQKIIDAVRLESGACKVSGAGGKSGASGMLFLYLEEGKLLRSLRKEYEVYEIKD